MVSNFMEIYSVLFDADSSKAYNGPKANDNIGEAGSYKSW